LRSTRAGRGRPRLRAGVLVLACALALAGASAQARTIAVPGETGSIAAAMARAVAGDIILVGCGTYYEADIAVTPGVSLWSGTLQPDCVVVDAQGRGRVLVFADCDSTTRVVGLTLRGGATDGDGGGVLCRNASPKLSRCILQDNRARRGGGLACQGRGGPSLEDCLIAGNQADLHGGGVLWDATGAGFLRGCRLANNQALAGGGIACLDDDGLVVHAGSLTGNEAAGSGGAVWVDGGAPEFRECLVANNRGGLAGGAVACRRGRPRLVNCTVADNAAEVTAGALLVVAGRPVLERSILAFNSHGAVTITGAGGADLSACNVYGHPAGDWTGPLAVLAGRADNFSGDPLFCSRTSGLYDLRAASPCLPGRRGATAPRIGAGNRGCD